jgi:hypothetical protein
MCIIKVFKIKFKWKQSLAKRRGSWWRNFREEKESSKLLLIFDSRGEANIVESEIFHPDNQFIILKKESTQATHRKRKKYKKRKQSLRA